MILIFGFGRRNVTDGLQQRAMVEQSTHARVAYDRFEAA